jgi:hypothetical protein
MEESIQDGIDGIIDRATGLLSNPTAAAIGGAAIGAVVGGAVIGSVVSSKKSSSKASKRSRKKITHTSRGWSQDRKRRSKQKWEIAYQKRKRKKKSYSKKRKGKHYTKNGQPYIILASGKARFIKKHKR